MGFALGLVVWLAYRPHNEQSAHHLIAMFALPWNVIVPAMVLAVIATFFAAGYPARAITRVPVVSALAGRPAPPRQIHRSLVPGVIALVIGFFIFSLSGAVGERRRRDLADPRVHRADRGDHPGLARSSWPCWPGSGGRSPIAIRLPLRDMARYRARSGSALSAISLGIMIAVIICAVAVARYTNVFDYVGPNMAANALNVYSPPTGPTFGPNGQTQPVAGRRRASRRRRPPSTPSPPPSARPTSSSSTTRPVGLQNPSATGRQWNGPIYVATPALLRAYGINPSSIPSNVDILSSRPGLAGSGVQLTYGGGGKGGGGFQGPGAGGEQLPTRARPTRASPTRSSRRRASCPPARRRRTR